MFVTTGGRMHSTPAASGFPKMPLRFDYLYHRTYTCIHCPFLITYSMQTFSLWARTLIGRLRSGMRRIIHAATVERDHSIRVAMSVLSVL